MVRKASGVREAISGTEGEAVVGLPGGTSFGWLDVDCGNFAAGNLSGLAILYFLCLFGINNGLKLWAVPWFELLLCATSVFSVPLWLSWPKITTETQRTQRSHREIRIRTSVSCVARLDTLKA